jgi:two-component system, cell cycle sensor histidine kinase and response regulator CckA
MNSDIFLGLVNNAALLLALAVLYDTLPLLKIRHRRRREILTGALIGLIGIAIMLTPWRLNEGVIFDTRSILLSIAAFFFGPIPALVAAGMTSALRIFQGGTGAFTGVCVILTSTGLGLAWRRLARSQETEPRWYEFYAFGLVVHIATLLWFLTLPAPFAVLRVVALPMIAIHPVGTILLGLLLTRQRQRNEWELALRQERDLLARISETSLDAILLTHPDGSIQAANPAACRMFGRSEEEIIQVGRSGVVDISDPRLPLALAERARNGRFFGELTFVRKNGEKFLGEIASALFKDQVGRDRASMIIRDITERKRVEAQLQQQERLASVGQLAAGIAHDFNNIMAVIILYTQKMEEATDLPRHHRERLTVVNQQAWHASRLVEQILDFSRRAILEQRPLNIAPLFKEQLKLLQRTLSEDIEIRFNHEQDDYTVNADPTRIQQMLTNLVVNARDAMPDGGALVIGLERLTVAQDQPPPLPDIGPGEWIRITVSDTGVGIPQEVLPHIFEPFFTTKDPGKGSGLGLAQVYGIVGQHGGHIGVETRVDQGAIFTIYLPALTEQSAIALPAKPAEALKGEGELLLVVEDEEILREALREILETLNYQVLEAANGREALAAMASRGEQIALILSDVVMPGLGGIALLQALRQKGWQTPFILLTGHVVNKDYDELQAQGVAVWLTKPLTLNQLAQAVAGALGK